VEYTDKSAVLSICGAYRYRLSRGWGEPGSGYVCWLALNPSTADALTDDPTIRRMVGFVNDWGWRRMIVVNLFAIRSTDPSRLKRGGDVVGPLNNNNICEVAKFADLTIAAWGSWGYLHDRGRHVTAMLQEHRVNLHCLGRTKAGGHPVHPLYQKKTAKPIPYP
jgi:hypothetical protein